jgi:hypothetical protein
VTKISKTILAATAIAALCTASAMADNTGASGACPLRPIATPSNNLDYLGKERLRASRSAALALQAECQRQQEQKHQAALQAAAQREAKAAAEAAAEARAAAVAERWRLEAEAAAAERQAAALVERQRLEAQDRAAKVENDRAKAAAAEEASPHGQIRTAYGLYIGLKWCHDTRDGYLVKYINDVEMERVETAIKAIVNKWMPLEPGLGMSIDSLWQQAERSIAGRPVSESFCQAWFLQLMAMSPVPAIRVERPRL